MSNLQTYQDMIDKKELLDSGKIALGNGIKEELAFLLSCCRLSEGAVRETDIVTVDVNGAYSSKKNTMFRYEDNGVVSKLIRSSNEISKTRDNQIIMMAKPNFSSILTHRIPMKLENCFSTRIVDCTDLRKNSHLEEYRRRLELSFDELVKLRGIVHHFGINLSFPYLVPIKEGEVEKECTSWLDIYNSETVEQMEEMFSKNPDWKINYKSREASIVRYYQLGNALFMFNNADNFHNVTVKSLKTKNKSDTPIVTIEWRNNEFPQEIIETDEPITEIAGKVMRKHFGEVLHR